MKWELRSDWGCKGPERGGRCWTGCRGRTESESQSSGQNQQPTTITAAQPTPLCRFKRKVHNLLTRRMLELWILQVHHLQTEKKMQLNLEKKKLALLRYLFFIQEIRVIPPSTSITLFISVKFKNSWFQIRSENFLPPSLLASSQRLTHSGKLVSFCCTLVVIVIFATEEAATIFCCVCFHVVKCYNPL